MAHLWHRTEGVWNPFALADDPVAVSPNGPAELSRQSSQHSQPGGPVCNDAELHRTVKGGWVLVAKHHLGARANGLVIPGIRQLRDRDEIRVFGQTLFFSTERLAEVEAYSGSAKAFCPRCRQEMAPGQPAVQCPGCGVWYHENDELKCWTYGEHCALCPQKTELRDTYQWTPEVL